MQKGLLEKRFGVADLSTTLKEMDKYCISRRDGNKSFLNYVDAQGTSILII